MPFLMVAASAQTGRDDAPWTVFSDTAPAHAEPDTSSTVAVQLKQGAMIAGEYHVHPDTDEEWLKTALNGSAVFIPRWHIHRIHPANVTKGNIPYGTEVVDRWWGLPLDYEPNDLEALPVEHRHQQERDYPLRRETRESLLAMLKAARGDGLEIHVCSAYRPGVYQTDLYTRAVERSGANQRYSAPPGHSEHQLGTCVDLCDSAGEHVLVESFGETPQGKWLERNAARFGFKRSYYPHNTGETGYISEPWHWRYWGKPKGS